MAPLVTQAFEAYGTGHFSLARLVEEMYARGLRNRRGGKVTISGMSKFLNNPFYISVIRIKKTGELFRGAHKPIVAKALFDRVQQILDGKQPLYPAHSRDATFKRAPRVRKQQPENFKLPLS